MTKVNQQEIARANEENAAQREDAAEIDLVELFYRLVASWKMITCLALAGLLLAFFITVFFITPTYESTATIYVLSNKDSALNLSDLQIGTSLTQDYIKVFDIWEVHEQVLSNLNLPYTYKQAAEMLSVSNDSGTRMLDITVTSTSPEEAAAMANEYAEVARNYIADTMMMEKPSIMSVALVPANPVAPSKVKNALIGFVLGFVLGAAIVVLRMLMDDKIRTADDIRRYTGLTNLAVIPIEENEKNNSALASRERRKK